MNNNLTIVYYTANFISKKFMQNIQKQLVKVAGGLPIVSVSQKPINFGENICVGSIGRTHINIWREAYIGAKEAKTKYIALAEDDVLYSPGYFTCHTPTPGVFAYNQNVWRLYTWVKPAIFSYLDIVNMNGLICERDFFVEAMEERFTKWPDDSKINLEYWGEPGKYEDEEGLDVTVRETEEFWSPISNIAFSHETALSFLHLGKRKKLGFLQSYEVPYWGRAEEIMKLYE